MRIKQLFVDPDGDDQHLYTILTVDDRIFVGGLDGTNWKWMEVPSPTPENTRFIGDSPFPKCSTNS